MSKKSEGVVVTGVFSKAANEPIHIYRPAPIVGGHQQQRSQYCPFELARLESKYKQISQMDNSL